MVVIETLTKTRKEIPISGYEKELTWLHAHDAFLRESFPGYWVGVGRIGDALYIAIGRGLDEMSGLCRKMGVSAPVTYRIPTSMSADGLVHMEL